jgi:hypothetical protein
MTPFIITANNRQQAIEQIKRLDLTQQWEMCISPRKSKRSLEQNSWMRGFASDLGKHLGYSPDDMYDLLMYKFCPEYIRDPVTKEDIRKPGHFSKKQDGTPRNTKEAADVQDAVQRWAEELGFVWEAHD